MYTFHYTLPQSWAVECQAGSEVCSRKAALYTANYTIPHGIIQCIFKNQHWEVVLYSAAWQCIGHLKWVVLLSGFRTNFLFKFSISWFIWRPYGFPNHTILTANIICVRVRKLEKIGEWGTFYQVVMKFPFDLTLSSARSKGNSMVSIQYMLLFSDL